MLSGKRTYILVALALVAGLANYLHGVVAGGFSLGGLIAFVNSEAAIAAIAALRAGISKK
jgi:hypothetical protein